MGKFGPKGFHKETARAGVMEKGTKPTETISGAPDAGREEREKARGDEALEPASEGSEVYVRISHVVGAMPGGAQDPGYAFTVAG